MRSVFGRLLPLPRLGQSSYSPTTCTLALSSFDFRALACADVTTGKKEPATCQSVEQLRSGKDVRSENVFILIQQRRGPCPGLKFFAMASPRTRKVLSELRPLQDNNVSKERSVFHEVEASTHHCTWPVWTCGTLSRVLAHVCWISSSCT